MRCAAVVLVVVALSACGKENAKAAARCGAGTVERGGECVALGVAPDVAAPVPPTVAPAPSLAAAAPDAPPTEDSLLEQFAADLAETGMCDSSFAPGRCGKEQYRQVKARVFEHWPVYPRVFQGPCVAGKPCKEDAKRLTITQVKIEEGDTDERPYLATISYAHYQPRGVNPGPQNEKGRARYAYAAKSKKWRWVP